MTRVAIYTRFSMQREASIEDQERLCRERAERDGWTVVAAFAGRHAPPPSAPTGRGTMLDLLTESGATISPCGLYRYRLWRRWSDGPTCVFVMLNPSTADAEQDDRTIRRCLGFARREGCWRLEVVNLFAFRATSPNAMKAAADPVGPDNDLRIREATNHPSPLVIAAWGADGSFQGRAVDVFARFGTNWMCLGLTAGGQPKHPLYVRGDAPLVPLHP